MKNNKMNEFATYDISLRMKKLGFDEPCLAVYRGGSLYGSGTSVSRYYDEGHWELEKNSNYGGDIEQWVTAPTWQSAFAWFRDNYGLSGWVNESFIGSSRQGVISIKSEIGLKYYPTTTKFFDSYEEAQISCLEKLIEIIERK
jgi:hypothetical protein